MRYTRHHTRSTVRPLISRQIGLVGGTISEPTWWKIDTLDEVNIVGAWDFTWAGHKTRDDAFKSFVGDKVFTVAEGNPAARDG